MKKKIYIKNTSSKECSRVSKESSLNAGDITISSTFELFSRPEDISKGFESWVVALTQSPSNSLKSANGFVPSPTSLEKIILFYCL